jgi:hypothetical protein
LKALVIENNHDEIIARMAQLIGRVVHKLSAFDLHIKYKEQILMFYREIINHRDENIVLQGILNLPCFNLLYKDKVGKLPPRTAETQSTSATTHARIDIDDDNEFKTLDTDLDFQDLYYKYANESSEEMRIVAAKCLHEGFLLASPTEDIKRL